MPASRQDLDAALACVKVTSCGIACSDHPHAPTEARYFADGVLIVRCWKCEKPLLEAVLSLDAPPPPEVVAAAAESAGHTRQ